MRGSALGDRHPDPGDHPARICSTCSEHGRAFGRQVGQQERLGRVAQAAWAARAHREPPREVRATAIAAGRRLLIPAERLARRTSEADMEMGVVPPPWAHLGEPAPIAGRRSHMACLIPGWTKIRSTAGSKAARRISAIWASVNRSGSAVRVPCTQHRGRRDRFRSFVGGQRPVRHRRQPEIDVEPDLMRGVAGAHRPAARLGHIAYQETRPAVGPCARQPSRSMNAISSGCPQTAVARQPHRLPGRTVDRQCRAAGETTFGVAADDGGPSQPARAWRRHRTAPWPAAPRPPPRARCSKGADCQRSS